MGGASSQKSSGSNQGYSEYASSGMNQAFNESATGTNLYGPQGTYLNDLWSSGSNMIRQGSSVGNATRDAYTTALRGTVNPGVADVIARASEDMGLDFQRNVLPGIRRGAVDTGGFGGSRQGIAEGLAAGEVARAQAKLSSELYTQALSQASNERSSALTQATAMEMLPWTGLESYARVIGQPIMESFGRSSGASSGTTGASGFSTSSGEQSGRGQSVNVLGKG